MPRTVLSREDDERAVTALRHIASRPALAVEWATAHPDQRVGYIVLHLLNLRTWCCKDHLHAAMQTMHRVVHHADTPDDLVVRRRAYEILTAVAMIDGHPPPTRWPANAPPGHSTTS